MKRVILDTNIYGLIVEMGNLEELRELIRKSDVIIYGNKVIREELRTTPKGIIDGINLRSDLLKLYNEITKNRELGFNKKAIEAAENYYKTYRQIGGITSRKKMQNDFLIVASASMHDLDIVVSEDNATMRNELALRAYSIVNSVLKLRTPRFIGYEEFKKEIKK